MEVRKWLQRVPVKCDELLSFTLGQQKGLPGDSRHTPESDGSTAVRAPKARSAVPLLALAAIHDADL